METLEAQLSLDFNRYGVEREEQEAVWLILAALKSKHAPTYEHSAQVALISGKIARCFGYDPAPFSCAGAVHDAGKLYSPLSVLAKIGPFNSEEFQEMSKHPLNGYHLLAQINCLNPFAAQVALRHHSFQEKPYPETLPPEAEKFDAIPGFVGPVIFVALADAYESLKTRTDYKGRVGKRTPEETKSTLLDKCAILKTEIKELYSKGIFS
jgi:response regulator RpfG family c-di-GMP phosphodiesterase